MPVVVLNYDPARVRREMAVYIAQALPRWVAGALSVEEADRPTHKR
ncbi:MAG: hypothetical protein BMS9Abin34_023 [Patescibacteria group bacterium]|nr:MAG: hypothetical protein BMS9Abin34_023 [Patescibacteria group bacterium]